MTNYPTLQKNYNADGKPFQVYNMLSITANSRDTNTPVNFYFSDRRKNENITVENPANGNDVTRAFLGGRHILKVPPIKDTQAMTVDLHEIELSFISASVRNMIFDHYMSGAYFEWHQGQANKRQGGLLVARPVCEMFGIIHDVKERKPARDKQTGVSEPAFIMSVSGWHAEFEDANLSMRSYEEGQKRDGDEIFLYADNVADWPIGWGKEIFKHSDNGNGNKGGKRDKPVDPFNNPDSMSPRP